MEIVRIEAGPRYSQAVRAGGLVFTIGQVAIGAPGADVATQTADIVARLDRLLEEAGSDKSRLVCATVYLAELHFYEAMNSVWDKWVQTGSTPARTCVQAKLLSPDYAVEIAIVAAVR
jgi:enamine deaminase RidA (YjgF/YER057c/UK114 family)